MKSVLVCSLLFVVGIARADDPVVVPAIYRNSPEFYGAIGTEVAISATLNSTKIAIGETTTLTLYIANVQNPNDVTRPPLESMPSFTSAFQIETGENVVGQRRDATDGFFHCGSHSRGGESRHLGVSHFEVQQFEAGIDDRAR